MIVLILVLSNKSLYQEGNPVPLIIGILKLEFSDETLVPLNYKEKVSYLIKKDTLNSEFNLVSQSLDRYVELKLSQGWLFKEAIGSGLIFEHEDHLITIETKMFSKHYMIINEAIDD